jgi:hypothetical protein
VFQESEVVDLVLALGLAPLIVASIRRVRLPGVRAFHWAYLCIMASYVFTLVETVLSPVVFNTLEHLAVALSGVLFAIGTWQLRRSTPAEEAQR